MKQIDTKIQSYEVKVTELTQSLEFTQNEVSDLKHQVKQLEEEKNNKDKVIKKLNEDLLNNKKKTCELEERSIYQEDYSRRNNLHIVKIEECRGET